MSIDCEQSVDKAGITGDGLLTEIAQLEPVEDFTPDIHIRAEVLEMEFKRHRYRFRSECAFERFMDLVSTQPGDGCWYWKGAMGKDGHPIFQPITGRTVMAAHFIMAHAGRPRPSKSMVTHRTCGNTGCVNPGHIVWTKRGHYAGAV